jgi:ketosteroid isomerase-like protein
MTSAGHGLRAQAPAAEQAVRQVEDRRIKAMIDDDFATLEAVLADDLTYGHSNGLVDTKASYLETLRSGKTKYLTMDRAPSVVRVYGDTAIITGTATLSLRGQAAPFTLRYTLAYVMREKQWRMVAWQSTRLP